MITQSELKELLHYDPDTGFFTWIVLKSGTKISKIAGGIRPDGYRQICINGKTYLAHRLVWLYVHGEFPKNQIDHINHVKSDNRLVNLRDATSHENCRNQTLHKRNKSGVCGVYIYKPTGKWLASIRVNNKTINLGYFNNKRDAVATRKEAEIKYGFHENHGK
jgi:hypothetical protein